jgi:FtsZ-binding cell division protein ZapB
MTEVDIETLRKENDSLKQQVKELQEQLHVYTKSYKKYYEEHTQEVKDKAKVYLGKLKESNPDKLKEYRHTAYLNRKAKLQSQKEKQGSE